MRKMTYFLLAVVMALSLLISRSEVLAAGDCSGEGPPNTCWDFSLGYKVQAVTMGDVIDGVEVWSYQISKK